MPEPVLAIDFGTSTSAAILVADAREEFVAEPAGAGLTWPSAVCFDGTQLHVGTEAQNRKRRLAKRYRAEFKLELGRDATMDFGGRSFTVSALITRMLAEMKTAAERPGESVARAVLTIPASYGPHDTRRILMIEAAAEAGFDVVELLPEPVAAALAPIAGPPFPDGSLILVYDLGGGTFDTALVRIGRRDNDVLGHASIDHGSGGRDIDSALYEELLKGGGKPLADLVTADRARLELMTRTEELKRRLSKAGAAEDSIGDDDILLTATKDRLEELAAPVIERTIDCVRAMLAASGTAPDDLTEVLLVGGAAQMPIVGQAVTAAFRRPVRMARAPQLAVVQGAARFAAAAPSRFAVPQARRNAEIPLRWRIPGESATLLRWHVPVGKVFTEGEALADVRLTDGAIWELRADIRGRLQDRHAAEGATVVSGDWLVTSGQIPAEPAMKALAQLSRGCDVNCVAFSPDGTTFVTGDDKGYVTVYDIHTRRQTWQARYPKGNEYVRAVAYSPDGKRLASAADGDVVVWELSSGRQLSRMSGVGSDVWGISFHPDGKRLALPGDDVRIWDLADGSHTVISPVASEVVRFGPGGTRLASADGDGKARIWDMRTGALVTEIAHPGAVRCVAFSPDGGRIASGSASGYAAVWDAQTGDGIFTMEGAGGNPRAIAFSPDGTLLATVGGATCHVWDAETGDELARVTHKSVYGLAFSPDGKYLATTSWGDDSARVWQLY